MVMEMRAGPWHVADHRNAELAQKVGRDQLLDQLGIGRSVASRSTTKVSLSHGAKCDVLGEAPNRETACGSAVSSSETRRAPARPRGAENAAGT